MAQRKLQQEVDRCFKKVGEGIQAFEGIFDKIQQTSNASQKEKLEDALKREIKKLQRQRDQIKSWAASNEIKDKKPLLEQRKLIETQMEKFKAVEKEMKTKAYSKEGLSAAAKLDPKEKEKLEACQFLSNMVEELERQIETSEAESESLQATVKKGKKDNSKASRLADIEERTERHKWHQGKLELILRALENGSLETEKVLDLQESIKYYVDSNNEVDFMEDDSIYDDLNLNEEEEAFGMGNENDHVSSQDTQSIQDDAPDTEARTTVVPTGKTKASQISEPSGPAARRPSTHAKSPLPALATLHNPLSNVTNNTTNNQMKPAPLPTRAPGETLKYASAAAAAAVSEKSGVGIAPLPPPPGAANSPSNAAIGLAPLPPVPTAKTSNASSPSVSNAGIASGHPPGVSKASWSASASTGESISRSETKSQSPAQSHPPLATNNTKTGVASMASVIESTANGAQANTKTPASSSEKTSGINDLSNRAQAKEVIPVKDLPQAPKPATEQTNGESSSGKELPGDADESVYHLPPGLQDLIQSFEATKSRVSQPQNATVQRLLAASHSTCPDASDAEKPRHYKPQTRYNTPAHYPQETPAVFDDPRLYSRIDTDTLFYVFYYRQNTYQQYLAAKALKSQSWRFHKQYQTWFQRHEEPKTITEEFEQGTYRFFDYESTWMNRRKPDFQFAYKFLEDEL